MSQAKARLPRQARPITLLAVVGLLMLAGIVALLTVDWSRRGDAKVSGACRDAVGLAAYSLDGWKTIPEACTTAELSALSAEFQARGVSTEHLELARRRAD